MTMILAAPQPADNFIPTITIVGVFIGLFVLGDCLGRSSSAIFDFGFSRKPPGRESRSSTSWG